MPSAKTARDAARRAKRDMRALPERKLVSEEARLRSLQTLGPMAQRPGPSRAGFHSNLAAKPGERNAADCKAGDPARERAKRDRMAKRTAWVISRGGISPRRGEKNDDLIHEGSVRPPRAMQIGKPDGAEPEQLKQVQNRPRRRRLPHG